MKKIYKNFVFDLIIAVVSLVLGIVMLPPFGIGKYALSILLAITLVAYFLVYLMDKLRRVKGSIFVLTLIETTIYASITLQLTLQQFGLFWQISVCRYLGLVLFVRGALSAIGMYINAVTSTHKKSKLPGFILRLLFISGGVLLMANPLINDTILNWTMCIFFFLATLAFGGLALLFAPSRTQKTQDEEV